MSVNRLIHEKSAYLLQHAHNPVDWYAWGEAAFEKAFEENKPIFLSIGYSTCHWCHVMEKEVFESEKAAEMLNRHFVCIKVDREERPDVDHLYMNACYSLTGGGGWPLTLFMTPEKLPFFAGTYYPLNHFINICEQLSDLWQNDRKKILSAVEEISTLLINSEKTQANDLKEDCVDLAYHHLLKSFDEENGGFGGAPKFPSPQVLMFLRRYGLLYEDTKALHMCEHTLDRMFLGGLFDHLGDGFFRYSTDRQYMIPHFEKMLYDNAMLAIVYSESGKEDIAEKIISFCLNEFRDPKGGFYTAIDADSEGVEGKYYLFTKDEIDDCLESDSGRYCALFHITEKGNFEGKNHLNLLLHGKPDATDWEFISRCHQRLLAVRLKRQPPFKDKKIILSSNALMIAALAAAGQYQDNAGYIETAEQTAAFILQNMRKNGRFYAVYNGGMQTHRATSDDYAYFAWSLYRLYQATLKEKWLDSSIEVCGNMIELFADNDGLLWLSGHDVTDIPLKSKNIYDGALPSGNSIAAGLYQRLYILTGDEKYRERYRAVVRALAGEISRMPGAFTSLLSTVLLDAHGGVKVELPDAMIAVKKRFYPFSSYASAHSEQARICLHGACLPPISNVHELDRRLKQCNRSMRAPAK